MTIRDTSYVVTDALEARINRLELLGRIIDSALARGATQISGPRYQATNIDVAAAASTREATMRAHAQAAVIAEAAGGKLGRVVSLTTLRDVSGGYYGLERAMIVSSGGDSNQGTQVIVPSIPVSVTVYGKWEMLPR